MQLRGHAGCVSWPAAPDPQALIALEKIGTWAGAGVL